MSATDYLEEEIGKHFLRTGSWTKPTAVWVSLFTQIPNDDGTLGTEVSINSTGYGRVQHGPGDTYWAAPAGGNGQFSNLGVIQFGTPIAPWGTITSFGLWSAETGGTLYAKGALDQNVTVGTGDPAPAFAEGALKVTIS